MLTVHRDRSLRGETGVRGLIFWPFGAFSSVEANLARFFKYKSSDDLLAENARLGIDLRVSDDLSIYEQPIAIGGANCGNRWCIHPMEGCDGNLDGTPGELTYRRYERFGAGGAKLI